MKNWKYLDFYCKICLAKIIREHILNPKEYTSFENFEKECIFVKWSTIFIVKHNIDKEF